MSTVRGESRHQDDQPYPGKTFAIGRSICRDAEFFLFFFSSRIRPSSGAEAKVYEIVRLIPHGKVTTYGHIARLAGFPNHSRMVGAALRFVQDDSVPWQRVIGASGAISERGDGGEGAQRQADRLRQGESSRHPLRPDWPTPSSKDRPWRIIGTTAGSC